MMKVNKLILAMMVGVCLTACQKGPTDEQLKELLGNVHQTLMYRDDSFEKQDEKVKTQLAEADKLFDIQRTNVRQFELFTTWRTLLRSKSVKNWIAPRLEKLSKRNNKEGAIAAYYQVVLNPENDRPGYRPEDVAKFLKHPGTEEMFQDSVYGVTLMTKLLPNVTGEMEKKVELFKLIIPHINDQLLENQVLTSVRVFEQALELDDLMPSEEREALRMCILKQNERLLASLTSPNDAAKVKAVVANIAFLKTPIAMGTLIGGEAPEIEFLWMSKGDAKKLSDLKGKVVVLDFWATWCGPCVSSFPNIRELQKRYEGYPVEIVGVTSLQGKHIQRKGEERTTIKTEGEPQKELDLMKEFVKDMNMTWNVAFSMENVFDMRYGVKGIPHVAIIDAEGRVRYNGLSPYDMPAHEAEKIDALLKEAGLKFPSEPMPDVNYIK